MRHALHFVFVVVLFACATSALAQTPPPYLTQWGHRGSGPGEFGGEDDGAYDLDVSPAGNVYVVDQGNHRVQEFTSEGTFLAEWGSYGSGNGEFFGFEQRPLAVAAASFLAMPAQGRIEGHATGEMQRARLPHETRQGPQESRERLLQEILDLRMANAHGASQHVQQRPAESGAERSLCPEVALACLDGQRAKRIGSELGRRIGRLRLPRAFGA